MHNPYPKHSWFEQWDSELIKDTVFLYKLMKSIFEQVGNHENKPLNKVSIDTDRLCELLTARSNGKDPSPDSYSSSFGAAMSAMNLGMLEFSGHKNDLKLNGPHDHHLQGGYLDHELAVAIARNRLFQKHKQLGTLIRLGGVSHYETRALTELGRHCTPAHSAEIGFKYLDGPGLKALIPGQCKELSLTNLCCLSLSVAGAIRDTMASDGTLRLALEEPLDLRHLSQLFVDEMEDNAPLPEGCSLSFDVPPITAQIAHRLSMVKGLLTLKVGGGVPPFDVLMMLSRYEGPCLELSCYGELDAPMVEELDRLLSSRGRSFRYTEKRRGSVIEFMDSEVASSLYGQAA